MEDHLQGPELGMNNTSQIYHTPTGRESPVCYLWWILPYVRSGYTGSENLFLTGPCLTPAFQQGTVYQKPTFNKPNRVKSALLWPH